MRPIDPAELSALLDGELSPERASEVRRALETDPALRREYERLANLDAAWRTESARQVFQPRARFGQERPRDWLLVAGVAIGLLLLRFVMKAAPLPVSAGLALAGFAFLAGWGVRALLRISERDCVAHSTPIACHTT